jgi:hypothetical protein
MKFFPQTPCRSLFVRLSFLSVAAFSCAWAQAETPTPQPTPSPSGNNANTLNIKDDRANYRGLTSTTVYAPLPVTPPPSRVMPLSDALRQEFSLAPFYTKSFVVRGIPVISSDKASDYALLECAYTLDHMLADSPAWVMSALNQGKVRMEVMSVVEYTADLPESQYWEAGRDLESGAFWDQRARGMGSFPAASCAEENLLNLSSDPYKQENITIHEFSHTIASAIREVNPAWYERLIATYKKAMAAGLFANSYAANTEQEYWAEGTQDWFDCNNPVKDASIHNGIWSRKQLKAYDPALSKLLTEVYGDGSWRYIRSDGQPLRVNGQVYTRSAADMAHLAGLNPSLFPKFSSSNSPRVRAWKATQPAAPEKK